jgi:hypothetical protein
VRECKVISGMGQLHMMHGERMGPVHQGAIWERGGESNTETLDV